MKGRAAGWALVLVLVACGSDTSAVGVVTAFSGDLQTVESFTIRTTDGRDLTFVPGLDDPASFPLPHLQEHLASGERVRVRWEESEEGTLIARAISDA